MWFVLMLISFLCNGCEAFGLRVLAGMGLANTDTNQYLLYYYLGGFLCVGIPLLIKRMWPTKTEVWIGSLMALCSISGTISLAMALGRYGVPGNVAFPISNGGSLFVVMIAGVVLFRERLGAYGICGCALGGAAIVLLSLPG
jgi:multidrug transporter EmrE-like cation transporter